MATKAEQDAALVDELTRRITALEMKTPSVLGAVTPRQALCIWAKGLEMEKLSAGEIEASFIGLIARVDPSTVGELMDWRKLHHELHATYGNWKIAWAALSEPTLFVSTRSATSLDVMEWASAYKKLFLSNEKPSRGRGTRGGQAHQPQHQKKKAQTQQSQK